MVFFFFFLLSTIELPYLKKKKKTPRARADAIHAHRGRGTLFIIYDKIYELTDARRDDNKNGVRTRRDEILAFVSTEKTVPADTYGDTRQLIIRVDVPQN